LSEFNIAVELFEHRRVTLEKHRHRSTQRDLCSVPQFGRRLILVSIENPCSRTQEIFDA